jgi:hypothetical protein
MAYLCFTTKGQGDRVHSRAKIRVDCRTIATLEFGKHVHGGSLDLFVACETGAVEQERLELLHEV